MVLNLSGILSWRLIGGMPLALESASGVARCGEDWTVGDETCEIEGEDDAPENVASMDMTCLGKEEDELCGTRSFGDMMHEYCLLVCRVRFA